MASVESLRGYLDAKRAGWRTFRARLQGNLTFPEELDCPSERIACERCRLCGGNQNVSVSDIVLDAHGPREDLDGVVVG